MTRAAKIVPPSSTIFQAYSQPMVARRPLFSRTRGKPPSKAPTGQSSLQK